jgi:RNA polymerase sigma-70 factor (ECF subfamily)
LIAAINRGDSAAFEALYRRYRDWVAMLAMRITRNEADAHDVLQETFAYVLRKTPGLTLTARLTTFLYPVVRNLSLAARRKRGRFTSDDELLAGAMAPPGSSDSGRAELAEVMAALPAGQLEVVLMRFVDGLSIEEVALALNIPPGTVKSRLHHALAPA